jgi:hypothetical protein
MYKLILLITIFFTTQLHALEVKDLVGTWRLQSYSIIENKKEKPWCAHPFGIISYYSNGYMAVGINCKDDAGKLVENPKDMVFYTGTYELKNENTVVHHVENSSELSRISQHLERTAHVEGDTITLTGKGTKGLVKLVWKRVRSF